MTQSSIMLIIMAVTIILLFTNRLSVSMTLIIACVAMVLSGILSFRDVFNYMGSTTVWMLIALGIAGEAIIQAGLLDGLGTYLQDKLGSDEKKMIIVLYSVSAIISCFINGLVVVIVFMSVIDRIAVASNGSITRKHTYYPVALGAGLGSLCTSIGSSAMMNVSAQYAAASNSSGFHLFTPFVPGFAATLACLISYLTFAYPLQKKVFSWDDIPPHTSAVRPRIAQVNSEKQYSKAKKITMIAVLVWMIAMYAWGKLDTGIISVIGIIVLVLSGCIGERAAWKAVDWQNCILVVGALGFGAGVSKSGAGQIIAGKILSLFGRFSDSRYAMCIVFMIVGMLISNFMANNSAAAIVTPIALSLAAEIGAELLPFAVACGIGVNLAIATPVCRTLITITLPAGYSFKTMCSVGVILQIIVSVAAALALRIYF